MSLSFFLLWLVSIPLSHSQSSLPSARGFSLSCGASEEVIHNGLKYIPDKGFINIGNISTIKTPGLLPLLTTLRYFRDTSSRKYCYEFPVDQGGKYLVRTMYYYGGYDGGKEPPVFDQIIQGTKWSTINTTEDFANGLTSFFEIIVLSMAKTLSVCLARNKQTTSNPFISAVEVEYLEDSMYNSTDFNKYLLSTIARSTFGSDGGLIGFPDDQYNRFWQPFVDENPSVNSHSNITPSDFWNYPPTKAFARAITTSRGKTLTIKWPPALLPSTKYYIALYFKDNRTPSIYSWRVFTVLINGQVFFKDLNVTSKGVTVYAAEWPLSGQTEISLVPGDGIPVGPVINSGEIYQILPVGKITLNTDVMVMHDMAQSFNNPPSDWKGDPCLPLGNSWTGVTCSEDQVSRVVSLDLTNLGITGSLPLSLGNLSALTRLLLAGNKITGPIPDMAQMQALQVLHLENNELQGPIPESLGQLANLQEIFLQNNDLSGQVPATLRNKNIQVTPGNHLAF